MDWVGFEPTTSAAQQQQSFLRQLSCSYLKGSYEKENLPPKSHIPMKQEHYHQQPFAMSIKERSLDKGRLKTSLFLHFKYAHLS
jgi:hypothetical protein